MKRTTLFTAFALTCVLFSCQSNLDKYEAQKKKHFGNDYYTTVKFDNEVEISEESITDAVIDEGSFEHDTIVDGKRYSREFKYLVSVSKDDKPIELLLSGSGINEDDTPQYMTVGEFVWGSLNCVSISNIINGTTQRCMTNLIIQATNDCCFLGGTHCWIGCDPGDPVFNDFPPSQ